MLFSSSSGQCYGWVKVYFGVFFVGFSPPPLSPCIDWPYRIEIQTNGADVSTGEDGSWLMRFLYAGMLLTY